MPHAPPLGALLRQYSAGSALTCDPVDQGLLNRGYRLATTRGDYFLKHHFDPETADPAAIARQHRATQRLADLGVPVAPPLPGRDGRTVAVVGGHAYALHPWIDGRHRHGGQLTTVQCGRLGALLGVVHASLERVMPARGGAPGEGTGRNQGAPAPGVTAGREPTAGQSRLSPWAETGRRAGNAGREEPARRGITPRQGGSAARNQDGPGDRNRDGSTGRDCGGPADRHADVPADRDRSGTAAQLWNKTASRNQRTPTDPDRYGPANRERGESADRHQGFAADRDQSGPIGRNEGTPASQHRDSPAGQDWDGPMGRNCDDPVGRHWAAPGNRPRDEATSRNQGLVTDLDLDGPGSRHLDGPADRSSAADRYRTTTGTATTEAPAKLPSPAATGPAPTDDPASHPSAAGQYQAATAAAELPATTQATQATAKSPSPHPTPATPGPAPTNGPTEPVHAPSADPVDTFALIDDLLAQVRRRRPTDAFDELARYRLLERRALLEQHADRRPPPGGSVGWVHGDFHPFNLLYKGDAPAAIVDWDRLGVQPRAEEAVRAAAIFFVRPAGTLDLPKVRAYARAYRRTAGATPSELAAAVHRVWWERLNDFWMLRWHYERGDTRADSQFPAASALAVWWTREYDAVCGAFTD